VYRELGLTVKRTRRKHLRRALQPRPVLTGPSRSGLWTLPATSRPPDSEFACWRDRQFHPAVSGIGGRYQFPQPARYPRARTAIAAYGKPQSIRSDNGPEMTSRHYLAWAIEWKIDLVHIQPGKPTQNGGMESFNGKLRDECLNTSWFWNLFDARKKISAWKTEYNSRRPTARLPTEHRTSSRAVEGCFSFRSEEYGRGSALSRRP